MATRQVEAILAMADAMLEAIRDYPAPGLPSGHLYAIMMQARMSLATYEQVLDGLEQAGRIKRSGNLLLPA